MEIEEVIMDTQLVIEASVIGLPDALMGNRLFAVVVAKDEDYNPQSVMGKC